jgi:hypothetical protein
MICLYCNKDISPKQFSYHLKINHKYTGNNISKQYYDKYIKHDKENMCIHCGKETKFISIIKGYRKFCCHTCLNKSNYRIQKQKKYFKVATNIEKEQIKNKKKNTLLIHFGYDNFNNRPKMKQTNLQKYNVESYTQSKQYKQLWNNKEFVESKINKRKETCLNKYGIEDYSKTKEWNTKVYNTKKINNTFKSSKDEDYIYDILIKKYPDIIRQYKNNIYPFNCDFYIPSLLLYIEYQGTWLHGNHPFNCNDINDWKQVLIWHYHNTKFYDNAIETWTKRDIIKRTIAKQHNLNYLEIWNKENVLQQIYEFIS